MDILRRQSLLTCTRRLSWLSARSGRALFCLPLFAGLRGNDLRGDEAFYSFGVDRMLETGDWLIPRSSPFEDEPFYEKPPLKFWIVAGAMKLGLMPHDEFGMRFWDVLFSGIAFLYIFAIGRRLAGPVCGAIAVLVLFIHGPLLYEHGLRENNMEAPLFLSYCGGFYHYLVVGVLRTVTPPPLARDRDRALLHARVHGEVRRCAVPALSSSRSRAWRFRATEPASLRDWRSGARRSSSALLLIAPWFAYGYHRFGSTSGT